MAGTYTCTVRSIGGLSSGNGTLEVYCKYYGRNMYKRVTGHTISKMLGFHLDLC